MKTKDLAQDILANCIAGRTHQIARVISAQYDGALAQTGLTSHQLTLLSMIAQMEPVQAREMLPYLKMDQSTLSRNLDRMAENGWISSARDEGDRRLKQFTLTRNGKVKLRQGHQCWAFAQSETIENLGQESFSGLKDIANALNPLLPRD